MTAWEIALRVFIGFGILLAGGALYGFAKYMIEEGKNVSWGEVFVYFIIFLIGVGVLSLGNKILAWESLPALIRWIVIGFFVAAGVVCYVSMGRRIEEMSNTEALVLYVIMFVLFSLGIRLALLELER